jgi:hypothetical protein
MEEKPIIMSPSIKLSKQQTSTVIAKAVNWCQDHCCVRAIEAPIRLISSNWLKAESVPPSRSNARKTLSEPTCQGTDANDELQAMNPSQLININLTKNLTGVLGGHHDACQVIGAAMRGWAEDRMKAHVISISNHSPESRLLNNYSWTRCNLQRSILA